MKKLTYNAFNIILAITINIISLSLFAQESFDIKNIKVLEINSSINPASYNYIANEINKTKSLSNELILIKLNTPGGLVTTTKDIITQIGNANFPIVVWITPEGASATSAGAIIASAAHVLVMSQGTNLGAATPIGLGKDIEQEDGRSKAINDLVALVSSLSKSRGRNDEAFAQMISKAASYDAKKAQEEKIIDAIISNQAQLIEFLNQRKVNIIGEEYILNIDSSVQIENIGMDPGQSLLNIFANPTTAYILFVIGAALLYFEFQAPGGFIAGSVGVVCLILAGIGFQVLPLNFGALGLIILSFILFLMEIYITSYGVLTLAGVASLLFGSLFLFRTEDAYLDMQLPVILSVTSAIFLYVLFVGFVFIKSRRKKDDIFLSHLNSTCIISRFDREEDNLFHYRVKVNGEIWKAVSKNKYQENKRVKVIDQDNDHITLWLE